MIFTIHPKYIIDKTDDVYNSDGILYHLTLKKNLKKIQEKGFIPAELFMMPMKTPVVMDRCHILTREMERGQFLFQLEKNVQIQCGH